MTLETLQTFDQHDVWTKVKKITRQKKTQKHKKTKPQKRQRPKREFNIVTSGQFHTLAMFKEYIRSGDDADHDEGLAKVKPMRRMRKKS